MNRLIKIGLNGNISNMNKTYATAIRTNIPMIMDDMPHPTQLPIIGTKIDLLLAGNGVRLHSYIDNRHKKLGPIFYETMDGTKLIFISDPNMMKSVFLNLEGKYPTHLLPDPWVLYEKLYGSQRGLFFMNGEEWLTNRQIMNKLLLKENANEFLEPPIKETIHKYIETLKAMAKYRRIVPNLDSELYRFSIDVLVSILLGINSTEKPTKHFNELLDAFSDSVKQIFQTTTKMYGLPARLFQLLNLKRWRDFKESVDTSLLLGHKLVGEMLNARDTNQGLIKLLVNENVSDEIITRIIADFVMAAGDTTAYTTMWILYLISKDKEVVNDIRNKDKTYVNHIVKEAMRLYPVAPFLTRILHKESMLGNYQLSMGTVVIASIYTSGRDDNNFSKANEFLPYRWDRNDPRRKELTNHVPSASLPFALGARSCIGKKIAMIQITELIYEIVRNFDLKCLNTTEVKPMTSQVLVPNQEIKIALSLRNAE